MGSVFKQRGSFKHVEAFLSRMMDEQVFQELEYLGQMGVDALISATPVDSGLAAASWGFEIRRSERSWSIVWTNSDIENGFPVAVMIQYGHGTGTGGYVQGRDYINPAMAPVFDRIAEQAWKAVTSA